MWKKTFLRRSVFLLVLALIFCTIAVPASRSFKAITENMCAQDSHHQIQAVLDRKNMQLLEEDESSVQGGMDIERTDYSGTGANNHHDPKPPGSF